MRKLHKWICRYY